MNLCNINLGRDFILSAVQRRRIYRLMQIYLTLCAPVLCLATYASFLNLQQASLIRNKDRALCAQFSFAGEGPHTLRNYADRLKNRIDSRASQAKAVRDALPPATRTVLPLLAFIINQSDAGTALERISLTPGHNGLPALEFSLILSGDTKKNGQNFFRDWQKNSELAAAFSSITPVTTRRSEAGQAGIVVVNYRAIFKELP
jgi:hypothetical protein